MPFVRSHPPTLPFPWAPHTPIHRHHHRHDIGIYGGTLVSPVCRLRASGVACGRPRLRWCPPSPEGHPPGSSEGESGCKGGRARGVEHDYLAHSCASASDQHAPARWRRQQLPSGVARGLRHALPLHSESHQGPSSASLGDVIRKRTMDLRASLQCHDRSATCQKEGAPQRHYIRQHGER